MGIYDRLNYSFETESNAVFELSNSTINFMNTVPNLLPEWAQDDIANNTVGGYFTNPVSTVTQNIRNTCNTLIVLLSGNSNTNTQSVTGTTSEISNLFSGMITVSSNVGGYNGGEFIMHTNRISGVTPLSASPETGKDTALLPHYETAMASGQLMMYLTNQSDDISNNSPIMGSFTSVLIETELDNFYSNISTYNTTITNSLTITGSGTELDPIVRQSNLSLSVVQTMANNILNINTTLATRRDHDEKFYSNSRTIAEEYRQLRMFNDLGASANTLLRNYIGSDKLLTRLNS